MLQLVFAYCETRNVQGELEMAFGLDDGLPWKHISQDFKNFKARTEGTILLMGAKTFQSLPGKLPGREHFVISDTKRPIVHAKNGEQADHYISPGRVKYFLEQSADKKISIIGGASVLQEYASIADKIVVTKIMKKHYVPSTVKFPVEFIYNIHRGREMTETHFYKIDELTNIMETVYVKS